ncbi:MAG: hypothetical protein WD114_05335 [Phycisphaerales bacterium]
MKKAITVCMLAGIATAASAQDFSLSIIPAQATLDFSMGPVTFTIDVVGDASVGTHLLGGSYGLDTGMSGYVTDIVWIPPSWSSFNTDNGYSGDGNHNQVIFGQLVVPGVPPFDIPAPGSELGGLVGSFQVTVDGTLDNDLFLNLDLTAQMPFSLEVVDVDSGEYFRSSDGNLTLNGASIFIPTPSTLGMFGLAGLVAARRRR